MCEMSISNSLFARRLRCSISRDVHSDQIVLPGEFRKMARLTCSSSFVMFVDPNSASECHSGKELVKVSALG